MLAGSQTFFIPKEIGKMELSALPLSSALCAALKKLRVTDFEDLSWLSPKDLKSVSNRSSILVGELSTLIDRARNGEFTRPSPLKAGISEYRSRLSVPPADELSRVPKDEAVFIPQDARGTAFSTFELSVRLQHVLDARKFRILGDVHGLSYKEFSKFRNCGKKTVVELRELVRKIQCAQPAGQEFAHLQPISQRFSAISGDCLCVPKDIRDLNLCDLLLSVRLEGVLNQKRARCLGDLDGVSVRDLKKIGNCGKKTVLEIVQLIEKAAAGEFKTVTEINIRWDPIELVKLLDTLISELQTRDAEILEMRLAEGSEGALTLEDVGVKFQLTRERVRQIIKNTTSHLRRAGSRRLSIYLRHLENACHESVCPLTPNLWAQWLCGRRSNQDFNRPFTFVSWLN